MEVATGRHVFLSDGLSETGKLKQSRSCTLSLSWVHDITFKSLGLNAVGKARTRVVFNEHELVQNSWYA